MESVLSVSSFSTEFEHCRQETARPSSRQSAKSSKGPRHGICTVQTSMREGGQSAQVRASCVAEDWKSNLALLLLHWVSWSPCCKGVQSLSLDAWLWLKDALFRLPKLSSKVYPPLVLWLTPRQKTDVSVFPMHPRRASHLSWLIYSLHPHPTLQLVLKTPVVISLVRCHFHFLWKFHAVHRYISFFNFLFHELV